MPKKKTKAPTERHATAIRLNDAEYAPVRADISQISMTGVPPSFGKYAKHAVQQYPRLRILERLVNERAYGSEDISSLLEAWRSS